MFGYAIGGVLRGLVVGLATGLTMCLFVPLAIENVLIVIAYAILGTLMLSCLGLAAGIWSEKFDHIAAVTNFVVTPLAFLSGTFYSIERLPDVWKQVAFCDPFFYMIDGFRYGFIGELDGNLGVGVCILISINLFLLFLCHRMLDKGYKIKS